MALNLNEFFPTINKIRVDPNQTVFEIFSTTFHAVNEDAVIKFMINKSPTSKDQIIARQERLVGNDLFKHHNYEYALNYYYMSLQNAPYCSDDFVLALAERSKAHFALKNYGECLIDIERVLNLKFPEELLSKIYIRQSQCFLHFKQYFNTLDSCDKAYNCLKRFKHNMTTEEFDIKKEFIKSIVDKIDHYSTTKELDYGEKIYPKPLLKDGENTKFKNASNALEIRKNEEKGRHVVTKTSIKQGDILFVEEPYCAVRNDDYTNSFRYCSNCFTYCQTTLPCRYCIIHFYCNEHCRDTAWFKEHRWICYGDRNHLLGDAMRLTLTIIFKASINNFETNIKNKQIYGDKNDNYPHVYNLATNKHKMSSEELIEFVKLTIWTVIYLKVCTDFFQWLQRKPAFAQKTMTQLYDLIGGHMLHICMILHFNGDQVVDTYIHLKNQRLKMRNIGFGLYVSTSLINHSCEPNTLAIFEEKRKVVRAIRAIPKNTEITIDYLNYFSKLYRTEKDFFINNFKFTCVCAKCTNPLRNEKTPWLCNKCQGKAFNITENQAKCVNCRIIFNLKGHKKIEDSMKPLFQYPTISAIDSIYKKMKKIYHKDNVKFTDQLNLSFEIYSEEANIPKMIEICKELVRISEKYIDLDKMKLHAYLKLIRATGSKYYFLRIKLLPNDRTSYDDFQRIKTKGLDMLKYFVSTKRVAEYKKYIHDYFDPNQKYE